MPQSLSKVIIHIIFSTKDRETWLDHDVRPRMHAYVATICRDLNAHALLVERGCRSSAYCHHAAANPLSSCYGRNAEKNLIEMD